MTASINFSQVPLVNRLRKDYDGIESLADSLAHNGLIQPLILVPLGEVDGLQTFEVDAGGRRWHALKMLFDEGEWDGTLHHATTSEPGRPGYILKGEAFTTPLQRLLTEIAENLDRVDPPWQDVVPAIVEAWELSLREHHANGEKLLMRDFGALIGYSYQNLQAAVTVRDELVKNPERFAQCTTVRQAYALLARENEAALSKVLAARTLQSERARNATPVAVQSEPEQEGEEIVLTLSNAFFNGDSLEYMSNCPSECYDHIVTDPDYAVYVERLSAGVGGAAAGVHQATVNDSLTDLKRFIELSFRVIKPQGFCIFWYDLDHHEKLRDYATEVGFRVQRWPIYWLKSDYRANAAPGHNFPKNMETAMLCAKPNAVLSKAQISSVYSGPSGTIVRDFGHPFAKPIELSRWIFSAIAVKGQTVLDPFMGSGAICAAAAEWGLRPVGYEIDEAHFHNSISNLQRTYRKLIGPNVKFN